MAGAALAGNSFGHARPPHYYTRTFEKPSNRSRPIKNAAAPAALRLTAMRRASSRVSNLAPADKGTFRVYAAVR